jgi:hypothetical protein
MSTPDEQKPKDAPKPAPETNEPATPADDTAPVEMTEEDEAIVLQRLRDLGYVD